MAEKAVSIVVYGKVQGVGFRYHTREAAQRFGVNGYVKNQVNGTVYIEAEGAAVAVDLFCDWCKNGPDWARVDRFACCNLTSSGFDGFEIR